ncbi:MAG TPA: HAMP domain-containing sensor histidine kinase [Patescibacteria group bacterium]|nr:HAMP domain-containing sensor histidine kinase [Patescibacteria group bacterium]
MLDRIYDSAIKFLSPQTLQDTYETAVNEAIALTEADHGTILLEKNGILNRVYTNIPRENFTEPRKGGFAYKALNTGRPQLLSSKIIGQIHPNLIKVGIKSAVIIPLTHHERTIGVLTVEARREQHFTRERLNTLKFFGGLVSLAIQKTTMYNEATSALKTRDLFISMAAHELRTPTTTIQGYTQMIQKKNQKGEAIPQKWIEILYAETVRLNNLLKELMQIEQIRTGQFRYEWKNNSLIEIIDRSLANARVSHPNHKFSFSNKLDGEADILYSDFDKILQILIILINNSAKFSPKDSTIEIGLTSDGEYFGLYVKDSGKGIKKRDLPHIFEGFYKAHDNTKEGFGLGLFLAENIVQRHNGSITAESTPGKGTKIEITLPKAESSK